MLQISAHCLSTGISKFDIAVVITLGGGLGDYHHGIHCSDAVGVDDAVQESKGFFVAKIVFFQNTLADGEENLEIVSECSVVEDEAAGLGAGGNEYEKHGQNDHQRL